MNTLSKLLILLSLIFLPAFLSAQKITKKKIRKIFERSVINNDHFTGFVLYDTEKNKTIYAQNEDKYFIPASNTKLYTYYTALQMLGDSIPGLRYIITGDSLIFWGTGDPSFLHSYLKSSRAFDLLKNTDKKLFFSAQNYNGNFYGAGWPYGNYNDYYQVEITPLPVMDNIAVVTANAQNKLQIFPAFFQSLLKSDSSFHPGTFTVRRDLVENKFLYPPGIASKDYRQEIPLKTSPALTVALLQDTLKKSLTIVNIPMPDSATTLYSIAADSLYRRMLLPSDNFIAEQLLLVCSSKLSGNLSTRAVIEYSKKNFLKDLPDDPQWVDGSGLSRQDLFTPRTMVALLVKIAAKVNDEDKLHYLLPAGGVSGTLRTAYKTDNGVPFVWGKTGSLSNNHNQSGYLLTRKGRKLIFSFMNNNFVRPTAEIRDEMVRIMTEIHNRY